MAADQKESKWYLRTMKCCFPPEEHVSEVSFLKIFASLTCIPCNKNYGKKEKDRQKGAAAADHRRAPEAVRSDQQRLLTQFSDFLKNWSAQEDKLKGRVNSLADRLCREYLDSETEYTKKNTNYKAGHFLSLFRNVPEAEAKADFDRLCNYYAMALKAVYGEDADALKKRHRAVKEMVSQELPQYAEEETGDAAQDMGTHLAIALLCAAGKEGRECACMLLGIEPPEREATLSVFSVDRVVLKTGQFNRICAAALRADLEPEELRAVRQILEFIWQETDANPDGETRALAEGLGRAAQKTLERLTDALIKGRSPDKSAVLAREIAAVTDIRNKCQEWLN